MPRFGYVRICLNMIWSGMDGNSIGLDRFGWVWIGSDRSVGFWMSCIGL